VQDTKVFFESSSVECAVVAREGGTVDSVTQKLTKGNMFTHHQKCVIVDSQDDRCLPPFPPFRISKKQGG
jgi:phospholipase D1/2